MATIRKKMKNLELSIDTVYNRMKWKEKNCNPKVNSLGARG